MKSLKNPFQTRMSAQVPQLFQRFFFKKSDEIRIGWNGKREILNYIIIFTLIPNFDIQQIRKIVRLQDLNVISTYY